MHNVKHILDQKSGAVSTIDADATVLDAARVMNQRHIGALVVAQGEKITGRKNHRDLYGARHT